MGRQHVQKVHAAAPGGAEVVRLADFPKRTIRTSDLHTPRGEILLFTGIRYERQTEPTEPDPRDTHEEAGSVRGSRRRKRRV
jgi:hypothetical protein